MLESFTAYRHLSLICISISVYFRSVCNHTKKFAIIDKDHLRGKSKSAIRMSGFNLSVDRVLPICHPFLPKGDKCLRNPDRVWLLFVWSIFSRYRLMYSFPFIIDFSILQLAQLVRRNVITRELFPMCYDVAVCTCTWWISSNQSSSQVTNSIQSFFFGVILIQAHFIFLWPGLIRLVNRLDWELIRIYNNERIIDQLTSRGIPLLGYGVWRSNVPNRD